MDKTIKQNSRKNRLEPALRKILQDFADYDIDIEEAVERIMKLKKEG